MWKWHGGGQGQGKEASPIRLISAWEDFGAVEDSETCADVGRRLDDCWGEGRMSVFEKVV